MRYFIKSTEPSRNAQTVPGYAPSFAPANKIRQRARAGMGEFQAEQLAVQRMKRMTTETADAPRHVVTIDDVTKGLGLDNVDEQRIQKAISETNPEFTPKSQTQRIFHAQAKLTELLRSMKGVDSDARLEVAKRARAWWEKSYNTALNRSRTVNFISWKSGPPGDLKKSGARGGRYYRRVATGNPNHPWKYYYTKAAYDREHGDGAHVNGAEIKAEREAKSSKGLITQSDVSKLKPGMILGRGTADEIKILKVTPKTVTAGIVMEGDFGSRMRAKGYQYRWDGTGFHRKGSYLHVSGSHELRPPSEVEKSALVIPKEKQLSKAEPCAFMRLEF